MQSVIGLKDDKGIKPFCEFGSFPHIKENVIARNVVTKQSDE